MPAYTKVLPVACLLIGAGAAASWGVRSVPAAKNQVEAAYAEVVNQYRRQADLIPNLSAVVKRYAQHERETLEAVTRARADATRAAVDPSRLTPAALGEFQEAQAGLQSALGRLMAVSERYPDLRADRAFRDLQAQLEGSQNRIAVARGRHINAIRHFNDQLTVPPTSWTNALYFHFDPLPQWGVADTELQEIEGPPGLEL